METTLAWFDISDLTNDQIDGFGVINGISFTGVNAAGLVAAMPGIFRLQPNRFGTPKLCCPWAIGGNIELKVNTNTANPYVATPKLWEPVEPIMNEGIIGPHPIKVYKPGGNS